MNRLPIDRGALRAALVGQTAMLTMALLGEPNRKLSNNKQLRFGRKGSIAVSLTGGKAGLWFDHEKGIGGDLIYLIQRERNVSFLEAIDYAQEFIGSAPVSIQTNENRTREPVSNQNGCCARHLWMNAVPIRDTVAEIYLARRAIYVGPEVDGEVFRSHPACPFGNSWYPCLVALMRDIRTDEPRAVQRTALTADGRKIGRMTLGPKTGAAIKFSSDETVTHGLAVGEGAETVLSGMALGFTPAWALGDASNLASFSVLSGIDCLTIIVDHDASGTGQRAAMECSARWTAAGIEVRRVIPRLVGHDMNDLILARAEK